MNAKYQKKEMTKFSFIVPIYNSQKYLSDTIESIIIQNYKNWELILVNDGSIDSSSEIAEKYSANYENIFLLNQTNQGPLQARVNGLSLVTGDYILFLDSDDYISKDMLEILSKNIVEDYYDMVIFNYNNVNESGNITRKNNRLIKGNKSNLKLDGEKLRNYFFKSNQFNSLWSKAISKRVIDQDLTSYNELKNVAMAEDKLQTTNYIMLSNTSLYINVPLYNYRSNPAGAVSNYKLKSFMDANSIYDFMYKDSQKYNLSKNDYYKHINNITHHYLGGLFRLIATNILTIQEINDITNDFKREKLFIKLYDEKLNIKNKFLIRIIKKNKFLFKLICFINSKRLGK